MSEVYKTPMQQAKSMFTSDDEKYCSELKQLGIPENEHENYLKSIGQSEREAKDRERVNKEINSWNEKNAQKIARTNPQQMDAIRKAAIKEFGLTTKFNNAFYMLPDGTMLDGSGGSGRRMLDHRDIGSSYLNANVDLQEIEQGGNSHNMMDFMRGGNIRLIPETNAIDLMSKPSEQQLNQIYKLWRMGYLDNIEVSSSDDKYGQSLGYLEDIQNERQIRDFINKYYK